MRQGRSFRYAHTEPYYPALPQQTAAKRKGDCKDKALWLSTNSRTPPPASSSARKSAAPAVSHAWVMWQSEGQWWILDCTMTSRPIPADRVEHQQIRASLLLRRRAPLFRHTDKHRRGGERGRQVEGSGRVQDPATAEKPRWLQEAMPGSQRTPNRQRFFMGYGRSGRKARALRILREVEAVEVHHLVQLATIVDELGWRVRTGVNFRQALGV